MRTSRTRQASLPAALVVATIAVGVTIATGTIEAASDSLRSGDTFSLEVLLRFVLVLPLAVAVFAFRAREHDRRRGTDALTGLPSHRVLAPVLDEVLNSSRGAIRHHAVVFLRVRGLGEVNAGFGYGVGDQLLCDVVDRLESSLGPAAALFRMGGSEFLGVVPEVSSVSGADELAERVHAALDDPFSVEGEVHTVPYELGICLSDDPDAEVADLVTAARQTASRAREGGDRTVTVNYRPLLHDRPEFSVERLERAMSLGEFETWFQPIHEVSSGNLVAAEALMRWNHPERGIVPTREFLGLLVDSGLIVDAGRMIINSALREASSWKKIAGADLGVTVNVSIRQLARVDFVENLTSSLEAAGITWSRLCVEMDEDCLFWNAKQTREILRRLHDRGIQTALDEFGSGVSSLNHLRNERFSYVKLHRGLTGSIDSDVREAEAVAHLVELVRALGMKTVAVGVETVEQLAALDQMACDRLQGHLVGKPMPADDFRSEVERRSEVNERRDAARQGRAPAPANSEHEIRLS